MSLVLDHLTLGPGSELTLRNDKLGSRWLGPVSPPQLCAPEYYHCTLPPARPGPGLNDWNLVGFIRILSEYG